MPTLELNPESNEPCQSGPAALFQASYFLIGQTLLVDQTALPYQRFHDAAETLARADAAVTEWELAKQARRGQDEAPPLELQAVAASVLRICLSHDLPKVELVQNVLTVTSLMPVDTIGNWQKRRAQLLQHDRLRVLSAVDENGRGDRQFYHYLPTADVSAISHPHAVYAAQRGQGTVPIHFGVLGTEELIVVAPEPETNSLDQMASPEDYPFYDRSGGNGHPAL